MAKAWERFKVFLEWIEHVKLFYEVASLLGSLAIGTTIRAVLTQTHIPGVWITPIWLSSVAIAFWIFLWIARSRWAKPQQTAPQDVTKALMPTPTADSLDATEFFKYAYTSMLQTDIETRVRISATQTQPNDREGFYVSLIAVGLIQFTYDSIWNSIYKSQLLMVLELNRKGYMSISESKTYYDKASTEYPALYNTYTFDQWFDFVKSQGLFIEHPSKMIEITVRGKDFLKYLTHWGRYPDDRRF